MITNTRPAKKERISFRDNPLQLSGGWGGGKKKANLPASQASPFKAYGK